MYTLVLVKLKCNNQELKVKKVVNSLLGIK